MNNCFDDDRSLGSLEPDRESYEAYEKERDPSLKIAHEQSYGPGTINESRTEPKFKPGDEVTHVELGGAFIVTNWYWFNDMWWYNTGRSTVIAVGESKLRLVKKEKP